MWWAADGYRAPPEAEIVAVDPRRRASRSADRVQEKRHPLILDWLAGAGRSLFFGFDETWRWQAFDGEELYTRFWLHTLRYLAGSDQSRVTLTLDRPSPYRRGESLRLLARFPEAMRAWPDEDRLVIVQHGGAGETRIRHLHRVAGARGLYELTLDNLQEGSYRFWLSSPLVSPRPTAECQVLGPPGEQDRLVMDRQELQAAASISGGRSYTLEDSDKLLAELPWGKEVSRGPVQELSLWDHPLIWGLALALLASEWIARRWRGML
jgi:hypothetical protein